MRNSIFKKVLFVFGTLFYAGLLHAQTLCAENEKAIFSFQERRLKKLMSICKGENSTYLVYKFGTKEKVELQFPEHLDDNSWKKFEFSGHRRGGGKANAGFGDYSLSFINGKTEYLVFQEWSDEEDSYSIGINIQARGKSMTLSGDRKTQQGSLVLLESESEHIRNIANP